ncbi:hypothetical protein GCM10027443_30360 [Pontibacter brevis]
MNIQVMLGTAFLAALLLVQEDPKTTATGTSYSNSDAMLTEAQKVERLILFIRGLEGAIFIRNGSEHNCQQAADHLQAKWRKHMSKIRTARDFIEALASASGITGEPYKIRFPDGTVVGTKEVLMQELRRLEQQ